MSTAMLRATFPKGAKELSVSLMQVGGEFTSLRRVVCGENIEVHIAKVQDRWITEKAQACKLALVCVDSMLCILSITDIYPEQASKNLGVRQARQCVC
jgi:hypothetical protein